jgi:hypothetical protein
VAEARYYLDRIEQSEHQLRELMAQPAAGNTATRARASLASLLAGVGRRAEAQRTLAPLLAGGAFDHHVTYRIATTHAQLGQAAQAVTWLKRSADNGFPCYPWFEKDSQLDRVRQDASFQRLMAELRDDYEVRRARYKPVRPAF